MPETRHEWRLCFAYFRSYYPAVYADHAPDGKAVYIRAVAAAIGRVRQRLSSIAPRQVVEAIFLEIGRQNQCKVPDFRGVALIFYRKLRKQKPGNWQCDKSVNFSTFSVGSPCIPENAVLKCDILNVCCACILWKMPKIKANLSESAYLDRGQNLMKKEEDKDDRRRDQ